MKQFDVDLDRGRCGPEQSIDAWSRVVPNPAAVKFQRVAEGRDVTVTLEIDPASGSTRTISVEVRDTSSGESITGTALRAFRLPELVSMAIRYLRLPRDEINKGNHLPTTMATISTEDVLAFMAGTEPWDPDQYHVDRRLDVDGWPATDEEIERLEKEGPRSKVGTRTIAALYLLATDPESGQLPPNKYIEDVLGWSSARVSYWVDQARKAGTLPPSTRKSRRDRQAK